MKELDAQDVKTLIDEGRALIVDVREQDEFDEAHIEGSALHPMSAFNPHDVAPSADGKKLVFMCFVGQRSARMLQVFEAFYPDAECYNMKGGAKAWIEAGFPVVHG